MMRQSTRFCTLFLILCATAVLLLAIQATGDNWASPGGKGSYALVKPADGTKPDGGPVRMTLPAVGPNVDASAGDRIKALFARKRLGRALSAAVGGSLVAIGAKIAFDRR